jgi:O-antigen/teichoic acid export membrane protein
MHIIIKCLVKLISRRPISSGSISNNYSKEYTRCCRIILGLEFSLQNFLLGEKIMNERKAGAVLSYLILILNSIIGILYTPIMLRLMGQSEYGLYSLVASIISYLAIFDLGLGNAMIRYTAKYRAIGDQTSEAKLTGMFLVIYSGIGLIVLILGLYLSNHISSLFSASLNADELEKTKLLFIILSVNLALSFPLSIFGSIITAYEKFIFPKVITIVRTILMPCIMIPLLLAGYRSVAMVIVISILNLVGLLINTGYCYKKLNIKIALRNFDFTQLKEIAPYSFYVFLNIVVDRLYSSTDQVILGIVSGAAAVSVYAIAMQLNGYFVMFSTSINSVFLPKLTKIATTNKNQDEEMSNVFLKVGRIQFIILALLLSGFILYGQEFLLLWAGKGYSDAYYICLIIMIPSIIPLSQNIGITILQAKNMHRFRSVVYLFIAILNIIISFPLAKLYGGIGVAFGTSLATLTGQIIMMNWYYWKRIGINIPEYWNQITRLTLCIIIIVFLGLYLNSLLEIKNWISLIRNAAIYSFLFFFIVWKFAMNKYERNLLGFSTHKLIKKVRGNE